MHIRTVASRLKLPRRRARILALPALVVGVLLMAGCSVGSYPIDYFPEMHYGQNYRVQEVPRLDKPAGAVVFQGAGADSEMVVVSNFDTTQFVDMAGVRTPYASDATTFARGQEVFRINCAGCHGVGGDGKSPSGGIALPGIFIGGIVQGPVRFVNDPATDDDDRDSIAMGRTAGELYWVITCGTETLWEPHGKSLVSHGNTPDYCSTGRAAQAHPDPEKPRGNMPAFAKFLTPEDRWAVVQVVEEMQSR